MFRQHEKFGFRLGCEYEDFEGCGGSGTFEDLTLLYRRAVILFLLYSAAF